jgi:hypothetical protein
MDGVDYKRHREVMGKVSKESKRWVWWRNEMGRSLRDSGGALATMTTSNDHDGGTYVTKQRRWMRMDV